MYIYIHNGNYSYYVLLIMILLRCIVFLCNQIGYNPHCLIVFTYRYVSKFFIFIKCNYNLCYINLVDSPTTRYDGA